MKKLALNITSQDDEEIIARTLYNILKDYNPSKRSDHNYIKISIFQNLAIIIKMLNPFCNGKSCILMAYVTNEIDDVDKCIYGQAMQYDISPDTTHQLLEVGVNAISKSIIQLIFNFNFHIESILIYHNFDEIEPSRSFYEVMRIVHSNNNNENLDRISEAFGCIMSNLNEVDNCMMIRLYFDINIGDPDHISAEFTCKIQYSNIFSKPIFSFSTIYPGNSISTEFGYEQEDAEEYILNTLYTFMKIAGYTVKDEIGAIVIYKQKKESNYV